MKKDTLLQFQSWIKTNTTQFFQNKITLLALSFDVSSLPLTAKMLEKCWKSSEKSSGNPVRNLQWEFSYEKQEITFSFPKPVQKNPDICIALLQATQLHMTEPFDLLEGQLELQRRNLSLDYL